MRNTYSLLICDDHTLFANGLASMFTKLNFLVTVTFNSEDCISKLKYNQYDFFISDINIDHRNGFEIIDQMSSNLMNTKIILLSAYQEMFLIQKAQKFGCHAFLRKDTSFDALQVIMECEKSNELYFTPPSIKHGENFTKKDDSVLLKSLLSKQEKRIIQLIIEGKKSVEISPILFISKNTVDTHRRNIYKKLKITSLASLISFANENDITA